MRAIYLIILGLVTSISALPSSSVRLTKRRDQPQGNFPEPHFWQESLQRDHYDARYIRRVLDDEAQCQAIRVLMQTYLATFRELGIETWLMHGTLLGWWWGKKVMPWDFDADVQVSEADMYFMATYHNMTTYYFEYDAIPEGRQFLLEVNPFYVHRKPDDRLNVVDARWIDMSTGLFIDITAARYAADDPGLTEGMLYDKNGHLYRDTYVFPLIPTTFEGEPAKIPYRYEELLAAEYGSKALTKTQFLGHKFDDDLMQWVSMEEKPLKEHGGEDDYREHEH